MEIYICWYRKDIQNKTRVKKQIKEQHALYDLNTQTVWKTNHDDGIFVDLYFILFFIAWFIIIIIF